MYGNCSCQKYIVTLCNIKEIKYIDKIWLTYLLFFSQISSVDPELPLYMNGRPEPSLDSYAAAHHAMLIQANQLMRERGSPPRYPSLDSHDTPLNLSLSSSQNSSYSSNVPRPSVITCAPNVERGQQKLSSSVSPQSLPSPSRREVITGIAQVLLFLDTCLYWTC